MSFDRYKCFLVHEDYTSFSAKEKLEELIEKMRAINKIEQMKVWRNRYASDEQYKEEYPEDHDKNLAIVWKFLKENYINYADDINQEGMKLQGHDKTYFDIIFEFGTQDIEQILFGDSEND